MKAARIAEPMQRHCTCSESGPCPACEADAATLSAALAEDAGRRT